MQHFFSLEIVNADDGAFFRQHAARERVSGASSLVCTDLKLNSRTYDGHNNSEFILSRKINNNFVRNFATRENTF